MLMIPDFVNPDFVNVDADISIFHGNIAIFDGDVMG
jgi:hypothetical protein